MRLKKKATLQKRIVYSILFYWNMAIVTTIAQSNYDIWISGVQINSENEHDVLGDGTITYRNDTLILNNANIEPPKIYPSIIYQGKCVPPLFCTAYIDPRLQGDYFQVEEVARYPLALVPQDIRTKHVAWRNKIRELNPSILFLAYQIIIEETTVPGPGHDELRKLGDAAWCVYPDGTIPQVNIGTVQNPKWRRLYDPRNEQWQEALIRACKKVLGSYPYAGIFLDQCSVFPVAHPNPAVRREMLAALNNTLLRLREEFPDNLLIGNSRYSYSGLNGEMNENRLKELPNEIGKIGLINTGFAAERHLNSHPEIELYTMMEKGTADKTKVKEHMQKAYSLGAFFSVSDMGNYQHVTWFDFYDEVIDECKKDISNDTNLSRLGDNFGILSWVDGLTILLQGNNTVKANYGLHLNKNTTVTGDGTIEIKGDRAGIFIGQKNTLLTISGNCSVNASGTDYGLAGNPFLSIHAGDKRPILKINASNVTAVGNSEFSIGGLENLYLNNSSIDVPQGAVFDRVLSGITVEGELVKSQQVIIKSIPSNLSSLKEVDIRILSEKGKIVVEVPNDAFLRTDIQVFDAWGHLVQIIENNKPSLLLHPGLYFIKTDNISKKIVVE